jgi:hypothetical protein
MNVDDLCPHKDDPTMAAAWAECLRISLFQPEISNRCETETGIKKSDTEEYLIAFTKWFNERMWGVKS